MPKSPPNVLLLFTDQQRADTIGALGNRVIRTPNLDRIVRGGVAFTSAYSPSPVCVPARCSMHYGQYPLRTGCYDNSFPMPEDRPSFMDALTEVGYRTHGIGKCHFRPDSHALRGFRTRQRQEELTPKVEDDDYLTFLHSNGFQHVCEPHGVRGEMYYVPQPSQLPQRLHPTNWVGDQAVRFLEELDGKSEPWMCFASFIHPHPPFAPPNPWHKIYRAPTMPLPHVPPDVEALHTHVNRQQNRSKYRDQGIDRDLLRCIKAYYYACISFIDFQVGRILDTLDKTGQTDNTLIVYTSDHGEHLGDFHCFGKRSMHDSCARVPLLVRFPGRFESNAKCDRPASLVDIAPTILAATGTNMPNPDGVDLADLAAGAVERPMVYSQYQRAGQAIYTAVNDRWKYSYSAPDHREFLFDRHAPTESRDLSGVVFAREAQHEMRQALIAHLREGGEADAVDGDGWKVYPKPDWPDNPDANLGHQDPRWPVLTVPGYSD